jgi:predicted ATP-binding protein involved in virulence
MKIKGIDIKGVGCIRDLHLDFNDRMNILCGPNSIGKTTVIESVAAMFVHGQPNVKRNVSCEKGYLSALVEIDGQIRHSTIEIRQFNPNEKETTSSFTDLTPKVLSIKVGRNFGYSKLDAVPSDANRPTYEVWNEAILGVTFDGVKGWFVNRYLYSAREGTLSEQQLSNYHLAERCFSIINSQYSFSRVLGATNDIMVNTPQGEIYFEYLSSGFKSILYLLFSTIKEIEFRFKDHNLKAEDYDGIILIDEVEIHLHPEWQEQIIQILQNTFPNAQFIITTHSPHVIQTAEPNQIMALVMSDNGNVTLRNDLQTSKYGFKGWTVEEILYDVMGMKTLRTEMYRILIDRFGKAIDNEDAGTAKAVYEELDELLHPLNPQRKLLSFQLAQIKEA